MIDVIVIGGGASGLLAAIYAAKGNKKVLLLEKNNICGKKILITGNGKCNYFNEDQNLTHYHASHPKFISNMITDQNIKEILSFFDQLGIIPKIKDGYYYPYSGQATSIQTTLIKEAEVLGVEIICNQEVLSIDYQNYFKIYTQNKIYLSKKVIISTGSKAYPKTGSTGFGYDLLKDIGHTINPVLPALVQLKGRENYFKEWHGIRTDVKLTLIENQKETDKQIGEIQLTDYGISGICTFNLSGQVAIGLLEKKQEQIKINFLYPFQLYTKEDFIAWMNKRNKKMKKRTISDLLDGILNYKLINLLLKLSNIKKEMAWEQISLSLKEKLGTNLTNFIVDIVETNSFSQAQTCTGGVPLTEIHHTMESKIQKNLYITGELLDAYGDCGGYNLTLAWITGMIAGKEASK